MPTETSCNFARDWPDARGIWLSIDKTIGAYINRKDHVLLSITAHTNDFQKTITKFFTFVQQVIYKMSLYHLEMCLCHLQCFLSQFQDQVAKNGFGVMKSDRLGFLTTDPANLGTALKMSVRIKIPNLSRSGRLPVVLRYVELSQNFNVIPQKDGGLDDNLDDPTYKEGEEDFGDEIGSLEVYSYQTLGQSEVRQASEPFKLSNYINIFQLFFISSGSISSKVR